jgi:hypothetical protein
MLGWYHIIEHFLKINAPLMSDILRAFSYTPLEHCFPDTVYAKEQ